MIFDKKHVTVIILAKNEGEGLFRIIRSVQPFGAEIIVVDGHSTDDTKNISWKAGVVYLLDNGKGRGGAVRMGIARATKKIIVLFDADGSYIAEDIPALVTPLLTGAAEMVLASRHTGGSFDRPMTFQSLVRSTGSEIAAILVNRRFGSSLTDVHYGFRAFDARIAKTMHLNSNDHAIEQELVIAYLKKGYRVTEIPSRELARAWGESKLKTYMGIPMFFTLLRQLYT